MREWVGAAMFMLVGVAPARAADDESFPVRRPVLVTVAMGYEADGLAVRGAWLELGGVMEGRDRRTLSVRLPDGRERRYPIGGSTLRGTLVALEGESLVVNLGDQGRSVYVPRSAVLRLDVARRASRVRTGAIVGALVGGVPLGYFGWAVGTWAAQERGDDHPARAGLTGGAVGLAVGASVGALVGGAVGSIFPREGWRRVSIAIAPTRSRGAAVCLRVRF